MANYGNRSFDLSWLNTRVSVGDKLSSSQLQQLVNASVVLSCMRWSVSVFMGAGWTFSSADLYFFVPGAGSGRQIFQPWFCSNDSNSTTPTEVRWYTQKGDTSIGYTTTTTGSNLTIDPNVSAYNKRVVFGPVYANNNNAAAWRNPRQNGCGRIQFRYYSGNSPICFGVWPYSISYTTNAGLENYIGSNGETGRNFIGSPSLSALGAGILRVCEKMLDTAETMPIPICSTPVWTGATAGLAFNAAALSVNNSTNRARWVPIVNLGRPRTLWVAFYKSVSTSLTVRCSINGYSFSAQTGASSDFKIFESGALYYLFAFPISAEMLAATNRQVGGLPVHFVTVSVSSTAQGLAAWIGDAP